MVLEEIRRKKVSVGDYISSVKELFRGKFLVWKESLST